MGIETFFRPKQQPANPSPESEQDFVTGKLKIGDFIDRLRQEYGENAVRLDTRMQGGKQACDIYVLDDPGVPFNQTPEAEVFKARGIRVTASNRFSYTNERGEWEPVKDHHYREAMGIGALLRAKPILVEFLAQPQADTDAVKTSVKLSPISVPASSD